MSDLHITPARQRLLTAVARGYIRRGVPGHDFDLRDYCRVSYRLFDLQRAGLVALGEGDHTWRLTDAGRAALESTS